MGPSRLRVYYGPETELDSHGSDQSEHRHTVELRWGEILPVLADAIRYRRSWLRDFDDDRLTISTDLYEVLMAYRDFRRPTA
ncbi:MAG: hypothetical protein KatS3mg110_1388 [Pirellulaceae bacterium]|nr:MAG: hypothetical protein KatS3mg110_1388 [Pirellulaceae bacterium]